MAEDQLNSISCTNCRSRKTKCSRILPECAECHRLGNQCHYPPAVKRGPPTGYIVSLEQRLAETEAALFETIHQLDALSGSTLPPLDTSVFARLIEHGATEARSSRILNWSRMPLDSHEARRAWWFATRDSFVDQSSVAKTPESIAHDVTETPITHPKETAQFENTGSSISQDTIWGLAPHAWSSGLSKVSHLPIAEHSFNQMAGAGDDRVHSGSERVRLVTSKQPRKYF